MNLKFRQQRIRSQQVQPQPVLDDDRPPEDSGFDNNTSQDSARKEEKRQRRVETGSPGFDQSQSHAREDAQGLGLCFLTALVEQAVNQSLSEDAEALVALLPYVGRVIRLKTHEPYAVVYCQICERGVRLLQEYDGRVDAWVQLPAGRLLMCMMQTGRSAFNPDDFEVQVLGDVSLVENLNGIIERFGIVPLTQALLKEWLPGAELFTEEALSRLNLQTPVWLQAWQNLPDVSAEMMVEVKHLAQTQSAILTELKLMNSQLSRSGRPTGLHWFGAIALLIAGFVIFQQL